MIYLESLNNPAVLFTVGAVTVTAVVLTLAVMRAVAAPAKRQTFDQALSYVMASELDIDTALNKTQSRRRTWFEYWADQSAHAGAVVTDPQGPGRFAVGAVFFGALAGVFAVGGGPVGALVGALVGIGGYKTWLGMQAAKRILAMEKQLPHLLSGLRANIQAGSTPQQSMLSVADDLPAPLGDEMRMLKRDLNVNVALEIALGDLAHRVPSREMQFLVASVEIAVRSGSDLDPQLQTIQEIVAQRTRIRQKLRAAVAQVKPTQYLALATVPLMMAVSMRDPGNRLYWFGSGLLSLALAVLLYVAGAFIIRLMIRSVENS